MGALVAYEYLQIVASNDKLSAFMPQTLTLISPTFDDPRNTAPTNGMFFAPSLVSRLRMSSFEKQTNLAGDPISAEAQDSLMRTFRIFQTLGPLTYLSLFASSTTREQFSQFISQCIASDLALTSYTLSQMMQHGKIARAKLENGEVPLPMHTLLIGAKYDTFVDVRKAAYVIGKCANTQKVRVGVELLSNAGHFPQLEDPYSTNQLIQAQIFGPRNNILDNLKLSM